MTETFVWCQMKYKKGDLVVWSSSNTRGIVVEAEWVESEWDGEHGDNRYRILWATHPAFDNIHWYYEEDYFRTDVISLLVG